MTLGFSTNFSKMELSDAFLHTLLKDRSTIPAQMVETGPVFDNVSPTTPFDFFKFPTPLWHPLDGGRYIGTGRYNVTKDPDENWVNNANSWAAMKVHRALDGDATTFMIRSGMDV
jgi:4-hydroxy-3-polyprenylbenzoate decarboxylase